MIEIVLPDGETVDLFPDTSISVKRNNPIFAEGVFIPGEYSLPLPVPLSPKNVRNFSHPNILDNTKSLRKIGGVRIYIDPNGIFYRKGTLYIGAVDSSRKSVEIEFRFGLGSHADSIKAGKLPDIVDEEIVLDATIYKKQVDTRYNDAITLEGNYALLVNSNRYEGATMEALALAIDAGEQFVDSTYQANGFDGGAQDYIQLICSFSGFDTPLKVEPADNQVWLMTTNTDDIQEPVLQAIEDYYTVNPPDDKIRFPMSVNQKYRSTYQDLHYINFNADGQLIRNTVGSWTPSNKNTVQPYVRLSHLMSQIADFLGLTLDGDFITSEYFDKGLIDTTESISVPADLAGSSKFLYTKKSLNLRDLVPDITVSDFLKALQTRFNLAIYVNENAGTLRIQHREPILLTKSFRDITSLTFNLQSPEQISVDGVALDTNQPSADLLAPADRYLYGTSEDITITTSCGSLHQATDPQTGLDMILQEIDSDPGFRLLFEGGTLQDSSGIDRSIALNAPPDGYLFQDIFDQRWKFWIHWHTTRKKAAASVQMGMRELTKLDWETKSRIDGIDFLLAWTEEKITMQGIKPVKVGLYRV